MFGFLFGNGDIDKELESLLKSIDEIEKELCKVNNVPDQNSQNMKIKNSEAEAEYLTDKILKLEEEITCSQKERNDLDEKQNGFAVDLQQTKDEAIMVIRKLTEQNQIREKQIHEAKTDADKCVKAYLDGFEQEKETLMNNHEDMKYMLDEEKKRCIEQLDELRFDIDSKMYQMEQLESEMLALHGGSQNESSNAPTAPTMEEIELNEPVSVEDRTRTCSSTSEDTSSSIETESSLIEPEVQPEIEPEAVADADPETELSSNSQIHDYSFTTTAEDKPRTEPLIHDYSFSTNQNDDDQDSEPKKSENEDPFR